jgi:hypothetical protein
MAHDIEVLRIALLLIMQKYIEQKQEKSKELLASSVNR